MGNALMKPHAAGATMAKMLETKATTINDVLPPYIEPSHFVSACTLATREFVGSMYADNLAMLRPEMLGEAALQTAQLGLMPGKAHAHVAWIFRKGWGDNPPEVSVMPQWQGYKFLMEQVPGVSRVTARLVHHSDDFAVSFGSVQRHEYDPFNPDRQFRHPSDHKSGEAFDLRGGYVEIVFTDGTVMHHFVSAANIERRRECSQTPDLDRKKKPGPWRAWYEAMALGKVYRDAYSKRVLRIEDATIVQRMRKLVEAEDAYLGNDPRRVRMEPPTEKRADPTLLSLGVAKSEPVAEIVDDVPVDAEPVPAELTDEEKAEIEAQERAEAGDDMPDAGDIDHL